MANYIISYDLNGSKPTHAELDKHMEKAGWSRGQILETVWYVGTSQSLEQVRKHVGEILSDDDKFITVLASQAAWHNLLISGASLISAWESHR